MSTGTPTSRTTQFEQVADVHAMRPVALREGFFIEDNILVNNDVSPHLLEGYGVNPTMDPSVAGVEAIHLQKGRVSHDEAGTSRIHRTYAVTLNGYTHALEITDPTYAEPAYVVGSFPGITESIGNPFRKGIHESLTLHHPNARVISVETDGIGSVGDRYDWDNRDQHGLDAMAESRLSLLRLFGKDLPMVLSCTSMGTVVAQRVAEQNLYGDLDHQKINIAAIQELSPALVDPSNITRDMALLFLPRMALDGTCELGLRSSPKDMFRLIRHLACYGLTLADIPPIINQVSELLKGTSKARIASVIAEIPTATVAGEFDSLAQLKMRKRMQMAYPGQIALNIVLGRGHDLGMNPPKAISNVTRVGAPMLHSIRLDGFKEAA